MLLAFQCIDHLVDQIVDVEQFQFHAWVIDGVREVVGHGIAECCNGGVIVWTAPFAEQIRETID